MKKLLIAVSFVLCITANLFSQIKVISPIEGEWANKQMLVIDNSEGGEYFYSLNGEDPATSGFAYDGPVLIDLQGDVTLRISTGGKIKQEKTVIYKVTPTAFYEKPYADFIYNFADTGIINYTAGTYLDIPVQLNYAIGMDSLSYIPGQRIFISDNNVLSSYTPCFIQDPETETKWRFVIRTLPQSAGVFTRREVPFYITDWNTITFTDENLIYKIDSEYWELPRESKTLDRSVDHMIYWQSLTYEQGNPIESFLLPAKPKLKQLYEYEGNLTIRIDGDDSYLMSVISEGENDYQELFSEIGIDTFYGDKIKGEIVIGLFANSVYQGTIKTSYSVNKRPPSNPVIKTNAKAFYSRQEVSGSIKAESGAELYVSVSEPYVISNLAESYTKNSVEFLDLPQGDFQLIKGGEYKFTLDYTGAGASYFKIIAYTKEDEKVSSQTEYSVIIDKYNFYYDESFDAADSYSDGTPLHPFNNFKACFDEINRGRNAMLNITGQMHVPSGKFDVLSNCTFINALDGEIVFAPDSTIVAKGSTLSLENFTLLLNSNAKSESDKIGMMFKLENSVLDIKNCQIGAVFGKNGLFADSYNSAINLHDTIISVSASKYAACVSGVKTKLNIQKSIINTIADTSVVFSINEGDVKLKDNSFKVTGLIGRIAELFSVTGNVSSNTFKGDIRKNSGASPVFKDSKSGVVIGSNETYGF